MLQINNTTDITSSSQRAVYMGVWCSAHHHTSTSRLEYHLRQSDMICMCCSVTHHCKAFTCSWEQCSRPLVDFKSSSLSSNCQVVILIRPVSTYISYSMHINVHVQLKLEASISKLQRRMMMATTIHQQHSCSQYI